MLGDDAQAQQPLLIEEPTALGVRPKVFSIQAQFTIPYIESRKASDFIHNGAVAEENAQKNHHMTLVAHFKNGYEDGFDFE